MHANAMVEPSSAALTDLAQRVAPHANSLGLDWVHPSQWMLRVASFGNLSLHDLNRLLDRLRLECRDLATFTMWMGVVVALPEDGDDGVWVELGGDEAGLRSLADDLPRWVQPLGFVLDRRAFVPRIRIARVNQQTTVPLLEDVVASFAEHRGPEWTVDHLTIAERKAAPTPGGAAQWQVHSRLPLTGLGSAQRPAHP